MTSLTVTQNDSVEAKPSWEGVQRASSIMECKQTLITNTPSSLHTLSPLSCFPVPSPPIARSPLSGQRWSLGQCVVVPPSVAVPLESGLVGPARTTPWLWPLFRHGFLHSPPPTWSFLCVRWCFMPFLKCIFFRGATNPSEWLKGRTSLACDHLWPVVGQVELYGTSCLQHSCDLPTEFSPTAPSLTH